MPSYVTRSLLAVVLFDPAAMALGGNKVRVAARRLDGWLERRRLAAAGLRKLVAIGDRELRDIGLWYGPVAPRFGRVGRRCAKLRDCP